MWLQAHQRSQAQSRRGISFQEHQWPTLTSPAWSALTRFRALSGSQRHPSVADLWRRTPSRTWEPFWSWTHTPRQPAVNNSTARSDYYQLLETAIHTCILLYALAFICSCLHTFIRTCTLFKYSSRLFLRPFWCPKPGPPHSNIQSYLPILIKVQGGYIFGLALHKHMSCIEMSTESSAVKPKTTKVIILFHSVISIA